MTAPNPLDEIQARANIATKGPWTVPPHSSPLRDEVTAPSDSGLSVAVCEVRSPAPNAKFIAHAREDVPRLVAALRAVEEVAQRLDMMSGHTYGYWARQLRAAVDESLEPTP